MDLHCGLEIEATIDELQLLVRAEDLDLVSANLDMTVLPLCKVISFSVKVYEDMLLLRWLFILQKALKHAGVAFLLD